MLYEARGEEEARGAGGLQAGQRAACPAKAAAQHGKSTLKPFIPPWPRKVFRYHSLPVMQRSRRFIVYLEDNPVLKISSGIHEIMTVALLNLFRVINWLYSES